MVIRVGSLIAILVLLSPGGAQAQTAALADRAAELGAAIEETMASIESRRMVLAGRGAEPGVEDAFGRLVTEVIFQTGDVSLDVAARHRLAGVAEAMRQLGVGQVRVVGYSDRTGPVSINARLALNRATTVGALLVDAGFPTARVETISALDAGLPLPVPTPEGVAEPRNRSARIFAGGG